MADFNLPVLTTGYAEFLAYMKERDEDAIKMLDGTTSSNLPSGAKRWNSSASKFEKYDGTSWSDLTTLYQIKVADSNKLNGQLASYYAIASHTHTGYAATNHTHSEYAASGHNHDTAYLGKTAQASDSAKLAGYSASTSGSANTIGLRDTSGDFYARLFRSTYAEQTTTPSANADICFRNDAASDNYMRFMSSAAFKAWLTSIGVSITDTNTWRGITDSVSTTNSTISASATAVKTAYDKGVEALNNLNTTNVGSATAGISAGGIGSYVFASNFSKTYIPFGNTIAGSSLRRAGLSMSNSDGTGTPSANNDGTALSGTWRAMGTGLGMVGMTLWLRIA